MRGDGHIFQRRGSKNWYIAYSFRGHAYQESSGSPDKKVAMKLLRQRLRQVVTKPKFIDPAREEKWTLHDMRAQLVQDYARKNNRSTATMEHCLKHLEKAFEFHRVVDITAEKIRQYANSRQSSPGIGEQRARLLAQGISAHARSADDIGGAGDQVV